MVIRDIVVIVLFFYTSVVLGQEKADSCKADINSSVGFKTYYSEMDIDFENVDKVHKIDLVTPSSYSSFPIDFFKLNELVDFRMTVKKFGDIPYGISQLRCLQKLVFKFDSISVIPEDFSELDRLEILDLSFNLIEELSPSLLRLNNLKDLKLANQKVNQLIVDFGNGKNNSLEFLDLSGNNIFFKKSNFLFEKLLELDLHDSNLNGDLDVIFPPNLSKIDLSNCNLSNVPETLDGLDIVNLKLSNNPITEIPDFIFEMKSLKYLDLRKTDLPRTLESMLALAEKFKLSNPELVVTW